MIRRLITLAFALPALLLAGCMDRELPTGLAAPEAANFVQAPSGPVVNSLADPGDGTCDESECTLREALDFASRGATITFSVTGTIQLASWGLGTGRGVTIAGPGAEQLTIRGSGVGSVLWFDTHDPVTVSGLTITGGSNFDWYGGGIRATNTHLTVENSVITGNMAGIGGGIAHHWSGDRPARGSLVVRNTTVSNNTARYVGGGIFGEPDSGTFIENSTISGNSIFGNSHSGGGIGAWRLALINSTVSGNTATRSGGGVDVAGASSITNSTIWGNSAPIAAGIHNHGGSGPLTFRNTIAANNTGGDDCAGEVTDGGYNLVQDGSCVAPGSTSRSGDPLLGPLADNGGPTLTHALLAGSPAIDAIPFGSNSCGFGTDQRGLPRPQPTGGNCDIGAFEVQPPTITLSINGNGTLTKQTGAATITGTLTCSAPTSVPLSVGLTQQQTKGRSTTTVTGSGGTTVSCNGTTAWSVTVSPASGKFAAGAAAATVSATGAAPVNQTVQLR